MEYGRQAAEEEDVALPDAVPHRTARVPLPREALPPEPAVQVEAAQLKPGRRSRRNMPRSRRISRQHPPTVKPPTVFLRVCRRS